MVNSVMSTPIKQNNPAFARNNYSSQRTLNDITVNAAKNGLTGAIVGGIWTLGTMSLSKDVGLSKAFSGEGLKCAGKNALTWGGLWILINLVFDGVNSLFRSKRN